MTDRTDVYISATSHSSIIRRHVLQVLAHVSRVSLDDVINYDRITYIPEWDSMASLRFIALMEEHFRVRLDLREFIGADAIAEIVKAIDEAVCRQKGRG